MDDVQELWVCERLMAEKEVNKDGRETSELDSVTSLLSDLLVSLLASYWAEQFQPSLGKKANTKISIMLFVEMQIAVYDFYNNYSSHVFISWVCSYSFICPPSAFELNS